MCARVHFPDRPSGMLKLLAKVMLLALPLTVNVGAFAPVSVQMPSR